MEFPPPPRRTKNIMSLSTPLQNAYFIDIVTSVSLRGVRFWQLLRGRGLEAVGKPGLWHLGCTASPGKRARKKDFTELHMKLVMFQTVCMNLGVPWRESLLKTDFPNSVPKVVSWQCPNSVLNNRLNELNWDQIPTFVTKKILSTRKFRHASAFRVHSDMQAVPVVPALRSIRMFNRILFDMRVLKTHQHAVRSRVNREVQSVNWEAGKEGAAETGIKRGLKKAHNPWKARIGAQTVNYY